MAAAAVAGGAARGTHARAAALARVLIGWAFACAWLCATFWWLFISMHTYGGLPAPLAVLAVLGLAAFLGLYYAVVCGLFVAWRGERLSGAVLLFAALWLLAELARGQWWTGFPWGAGGYAHVDGPLASLAPWIGVYGIGAVASAAAMWLAGLRGAHVARWPGYVALLAVAAVLWLAQHLPQASVAAAPNKPVSVALLQGNISQGEKFQASSGIPMALAWYAQQLQQSQADMVIAPETAIPVLLQQTPHGYWQELQQRFASGQQAALVGVPLGDFEQGYTNSMVGLVPAVPRPTAMTSTTSCPLASSSRQCSAGSPI
ncbi:apolipoprotein N-acyltransferase [Comamonas sp. JC664]|uniref:apolipoprotein N-acyltransferase n=1 Tax=Comamonas sp. JC664 TaxID=2801917 RepID=UPI00362214F7